jgi:hypothetical protein
MRRPQLTVLAMILSFAGLRNNRTRLMVDGACCGVQGQSYLTTLPGVGLIGDAAERRTRKVQHCGIARSKRQLQSLVGR